MNLRHLICLVLLCGSAVTLAEQPAAWMEPFAPHKIAGYILVGNKTYPSIATTYPGGGYETGLTSSYVAPEVEKVLTDAMQSLLVKKR